MLATKCIEETYAEALVVLGRECERLSLLVAEHARRITSILETDEEQREELEAKLIVRLQTDLIADQAEHEAVLKAAGLLTGSN